MCVKVVPVRYSDKHLGHFLSTKGPLGSFPSTIRDVRVKTNVIWIEFGHLDSWFRVS